VNTIVKTFGFQDFSGFGIAEKDLRAYTNDKFEVLRNSISWLWAVCMDINILLVNQWTVLLLPMYF